MDKTKRAYIDELAKKLEGVDQCDSDWEKYVRKLYMAIIGTHMASLLQLVKDGPVHDGDVISKSLRDDLVEWKLATRVMCRDAFGYTAATYLGGFVARQHKNEKS